MERELERYASAAKDAGCPPDQVERFVRAGYVAQPKQLAFHAAARQADDPAGPNLIALGGTRNSAKTHAVFAQVCLDDCQRYPGLKFLFLRHIKSSAAQSFDDLASKMLRHVPHEKNSERVLFPNGSRVLIGGFKDASDIDKFVGIEYDGIAVEEVSQLSKDKIEAVRGSMRSSRMDDWRERMYWTFNPGGVGYSHIKQTVVSPWKRKQEQSTRFFFAHWSDNVFCNPDYIAYLDGLTGHLRKSWRDGDLDAFEGLAFTTFDENRHVIPPFELPYNWPRWRAIDYGLNPDPFCCLWFARDLATGRIYIYREAYGTGYTDTAQARLVKLNTPPSEHISITYAGRDMFANRDRSDSKVSSNADEYYKQGIPLTMADVSRVAGKRKLDRVLSDLPDGRPGLQIFETCENWIRTVPFLVLKPGQEDIADGQEDHPYDASRYGLTNYDEPRPPGEKDKVILPAGYQASMEAARNLL